ncbi:MAG: host attachment protein [Gammaproteobacteria bacterium]|nr:host attachment protein [Gammaproteobacteria bacterium]
MPPVEGTGAAGPSAATRAAPWVLVADHMRARLFCADGPRGALVEREGMVNPEFRLHEGELVSDRGGRLTHPVRRGGPALRAGASAREHSAETFARAVCDRLHAMRSGGALARLHLIAEPDFLGLLRERLDPATRRQVATEICKSLTRRSAEEIRARLPRRL